MSRKERRYAKKLHAKQQNAAPRTRVTVSPPAIQELQQQAMAAYQAGQLGPALDACRAILARQANRPDVLSFAGTIATRAGRLEEAAQFYFDALALKPEYVEALYNLANIRQRTGRLEEAAALYRKALSLRPEFTAALHNLGSVMQSLGDLEGAVDSFRKALAQRATAQTALNLGAALQEKGQLDEAIDAYRRAIALKREWVVPYSNLVNALMERRDPNSALETLEAWLAVHPGSVEAQALKAIALNEIGNEKAARFILDFDRFVRIFDFDAPPGYGSLTEFNEALVRHVESHPTLKVPPANDPTYHHPALQITEELLGESSGPMADLEQMMRQAIARYLDEVPKDPPHPFLANFPKRWRLTSWATRLAGQGNLVPHVHHDGYLGGVYYPLLPKIVSESGQGEAGWFELGRPPDALRTETPPIVRRIQPKEGRMLVFPGYFFHNTIPFISSERRISIAWDLIGEARDSGGQK